jgi:hypothetical protein
MRPIRQSLFIVFGVALAACASGGTGTTSSADPAPARRDRNLITLEELQTSTATNLHEAIRQLRPEMLVQRGGGAATATLTPSANAPDAGQITVYMDNTKLNGGLVALRDIPVSSVKEVRYLNASDATQAFGTGNTAGAIVLKSR